MVKNKTHLYNIVKSNGLKAGKREELVIELCDTHANALSKCYGVEISTFEGDEIWADGDHCEHCEEEEDDK